jgi:hypothetical protein
MSQIGRTFEDSAEGNMRRYWFLGGTGAGVLASGTLEHWGIWSPGWLLILFGGGLLLAVMEAKKRGDWDV